MKNVLTIIISVIMIVSLFGCSNSINKNTNDNITTTVEHSTIEQTTEQLSFDDYEAIPGANVINLVDKTNEYGEKETVIECICPICGNEEMTSISFDDVKDKIGQDSFAYTRDMMCSNWAEHPDSFETDFPFVVTYQLNK